MDINKLTPEQLRKAADLKESIDALQEQLNELLGGEVPAPYQVADEAADAPENGRRKKRRKVSPEGRANISAAAKARWAAQKTGKRSAAWSKALSEAMKARWARARREGKSSL
jgi:hypothetical protein